MIEVRTIITQIQDGVEYAGGISLEGHVFEYELRFGIPLNKLDKLGKENWKNVEEAISFVIRDPEGNKLLLDNKKGSAFLAVALESTIDFYNSPQTRDANKGLLGVVLKGEMPYFLSSGLPKGFSQLVSISRSYRYQWQRTPELEEFLTKYNNATYETDNEGIEGNTK